MTMEHLVINEQAFIHLDKVSLAGWIGTTDDALLIFEAARRGLIRRLVDSEMKMIISRCVFAMTKSKVELIAGQMVAFGVLVAS